MNQSKVFHKVSRNISAAHPPCAVHAQEALRRLRTLNHAT